MKRFREREILKVLTHTEEKGKQHWSSGDDVRLTRGRSPVQSWDAVFIRFCGNSDGEITHNHVSRNIDSMAEWSKAPA